MRESKYNKLQDENIMRLIKGSKKVKGHKKNYSTKTNYYGQYMSTINSIRTVKKK